MKRSGPKTKTSYKNIFFLVILFATVFTSVLFNLSSQTIKQRAQTTNIPQTTVLATNLDIPWALAFLPDGNILFTERPGRVKLFTTSSNQVSTVATINEVQATGEGGLLGIAVHPQFATNKFVYLFYSYGSSGNNLSNRVSRYTFENNQLSNPTIIVDAIPGAMIHDGGRIKFGPDGFLYITTGDAQDPSRSQNTTSLAGKILRVTDTGQPAPGNPLNNMIFSYGHRNPQGIAWGNGVLYGTEHGQSANDEINILKAGKNYGWPTIQGDQTQTGLESPMDHSGSNTWAPSGAAFYNGSLFFAGLKGKVLYEAKIAGTSVTLQEHFKDTFGRIREVVAGPDNMLYLLTSNRDGRGTPTNTDDRLIRINFNISPPKNPTAPPTDLPSTIPTFVCLGPCPTLPLEPSLELPTTEPTHAPSKSPQTPPSSVPPSSPPTSVPQSSAPPISPTIPVESKGLLEIITLFIITIIKALFGLS